MKPGEYLKTCFTSENEPDINGEIANVVDALFYVGRSIRYLSDGLTGGDGFMGNQSVLYVMRTMEGNTSAIANGLSAIADAIENMKEKK